MTSLNDLIAYQKGELDAQQAIDMFQRMILSGEVWKLTPHYQDIARGLIERGLCHEPKKEAAQ